MRSRRKKRSTAVTVGIVALLSSGATLPAAQTRTESGQLAGSTSPGNVRVFRGIPESGAFFGSPPAGTSMPERAETEKTGVKFAESVGAPDLAALRAKPARELLEAAQKDRSLQFSPNVDGYVLPKDVATIFSQGQQSHVPLLAGWNAQEASWAVVYARKKPTTESFREQVRGRYGDRAPDILKLYEPGSDELASDLFIVYITWEWLEQQNKTGRAAVYGYVFGRTPPVAPDVQVNGISPKELGARHACEIEYVFGTLQSQPNPWERADYRISDAMASYWANFTKTGDPNGPGLENWPRYGRAEGRPMMRFEETMPVVPQEHPERYQYWEAGREAAEPPGNH